MAFSAAAFVRSITVLMVAVLLVATQMEGQGVFAARLAEDVTPAPSPAELQPGHAAALLPTFVGPALVSVLSFIALKHW